ncbi:MAG: acetyl/propionyl/methylcrotonyl-CoA carboxylase subunit alpha [Candidatus Bathyarchaeia archaeon]
MKLFIANRGEIALRIIRTCRKLGVRTVLVYSEADRQSLPLRYADERYPLLGSTPAETYLNIPKLVKAAKDTNCDAVHPGYGFLSEDSNFVKACEENGLAFIGPSSAALERLGNKLQARVTMKDCGVPVIPGSDAALADEHEAVELAEKIGYPVILKAVYGGGGRGMRVAGDAEKVRRFFRITTLESASAFGRKEIYIEKRLESPRHVEIQAIADRHGKVVTLGERECSIQRRHQKLLEEAPSVALDANQRDQLNDATVKGLTVAGYTNAGTVEFLLEKTGKFYFLEVNKRLQVEHLVSELTTRIDLVEEQLKVVSNESLELSQNEIRVNGWAINCRINAEDPQANFVPSPGTVIRYHPPTGPGVRIDSALFSGCNVPEYYDSLIAKLATWGVNRTDAIQRMKIALDETEIFGVPTTIPMHRELMRDEAFVRGNFDTTYLNEFLPHLNETILQYEKLASVVAAAGRAKAPSTRNGKESIKPSRWRMTARDELMAGSNRGGW